MKENLSKTPTRNLRLNQTASRLVRLALGILAFAAVAGRLQAGNIYVPNYSFESQVSEFAPEADDWQLSAQPADYDTNAGPWYISMGVFMNTPAPAFDHVNNAVGDQLAYLFATPGVAMFQDYSSTDWTGGPPTHAFNALYKPGKAYTLTVGVTSSTDVPLTQGSTLQLSLYYRDALSNMVTVGSTTVTFDTNVFTNLDNLIDFHVTIPAVQTNDAWAGKNIGIQFASTVTTNLEGGVWDLDNVRLTENLYVPNFSFESQATEFAPEADDWQLSPQPADYNTNAGPWYISMGVFMNTPAPAFDHVNNAEGNQLAYLFATPGVAMFQDYNSTDWTGGPPTHAFNVLFNPGKAYALTVGLTSSTDVPLTQGSTLQLSLYYRDASNNMVTVGSTPVTFDTNVFTNLDNLIDFQVNIPAVKASDPWAGKNIGIQFASTVSTNLEGGVWDLDNVRLTELLATSLTKPVRTGGQFSFTLSSEPELGLQILAATNLTQPATNWTGLAALTNVTGTLTFTDPATNLNQRFYRARQLP